VVCRSEQAVCIVAAEGGDKLVDRQNTIGICINGTETGGLCVGWIRRYREARENETQEDDLRAAQSASFPGQKLIDEMAREHLICL
jgi:hypothetical protein